MTAEGGPGLWRQREVGDTGALAASKYVSAGFGLLTTIVAARWLGPDRYGGAILAIGYCDLLLALATFKSATVATHYISAFRAQAQGDRAAAIVKLSLIVDLSTAVLTMLVVLASAPRFVPWLYQDASLGPLVSLFAVSLPFTGLIGTSTAALTATERFRWLAVVTVLDRVIMLGLVVTALWLAGSMRAYVVARALSQILVGAIMLGTASRALARAGLGGWWQASLRQVGHLRGELQAFFGWSYVSGTCTGLLTQVPLLLLGRFADAASAGFYGVARSIFNVTLYTETSLGQIAYPKFSAAAAQPITQARRRAWRWTLRAGAPTAALVALATLLLPLALPLILGLDYVPVIAGSQILMLGAIVSALVFWVQPLYYSRGRIAEWTKGLAADTVLVIGAALLVVPAYGWLGLCWLMTLNRGAFRLWMTRRISRARAT